MLVGQLYIVANGCKNATNDVKVPSKTVETAMNTKGKPKIDRTCAETVVLPVPARRTYNNNVVWTYCLFKHCRQPARWCGGAIALHTWREV